MKNATIQGFLPANEFVTTPTWGVYSGKARTVDRVEFWSKPATIGAESGMGFVTACEPSGQQFRPWKVTISIEQIREFRRFDRYQDAKQFAAQ